MRKLFYLIAVLSISFNLMAQDDVVGGKNFAVALGVSGSTNGIGGNLTVGLNKSFDLRLGYEKLDLTIPTMTLNQDAINFDVSPKVQNGGFSAIVDWHFLRKMYLAGGVYFSRFGFSADVKSANPIKIGDIEYSPDAMGNLSLSLKPKNTVAPYLALGFGTNLARFKHLGFSFEIGAYHTGSYVIDVAGTNFFAANGDPTNKDDSFKKLNDTLAGFSWSGIVPVVKIGISYRLFNGLNLKK